MNWLEVMHHCGGHDVLVRLHICLFHLMVKMALQDDILQVLLYVFDTVAYVSDTLGPPLKMYHVPSHWVCYNIEWNSTMCSLHYV